MYIDISVPRGGKNSVRIYPLERMEKSFTSVSDSMAPHRETLLKIIQEAIEKREDIRIIATHEGDNNTTKTQLREVPTHKFDTIDVLMNELIEYSEIAVKIVENELRGINILQLLKAALNSLKIFDTEKNKNNIIIASSLVRDSFLLVEWYYHEHGRDFGFDNRNDWNQHIRIEISNNYDYMRWCNNFFKHCKLEYKDKNPIYNQVDCLKENENGICIILKDGNKILLVEVIKVFLQFFCDIFEKKMFDSLNEEPETQFIFSVMTLLQGFEHAIEQVEKIRGKTPFMPGYISALATAEILKRKAIDSDISKEELSELKKCIEDDVLTNSYVDTAVQAYFLSKEIKDKNE